MNFFPKNAKKVAMNCIVTASLTCLALATVSAQTKTTTISHVNAAQVDVDGGCNSDGYCLTLFASQSTPGNVFLIFTLWSPNSGEPVIEGIGTIPSSALQISAKRSALNIDTGTISTFTTFSCTSSGCQEIPNGVVNLAWTVGSSLEVIKGTQIVQYEGFTVRTSGTTTVKGASPTGTVLGITFGLNELDGSVFQTKSADVTITY